VKTSDWIALGAVVVASLSFLATLAERSARRRDVEQERKDRQQGLELLQRQVEGEAEHRMSESRAALVCRQGSRGGVTPELDEYNIELLNGGKAMAHDVRAWIATQEGKALSDPQKLGAIPPGGKSPEFKLMLAHDHSRDQSLPMFLRAAWADGAGGQEVNISELAHV
jgi:hypothetical protein